METRELHHSNSRSSPQEDVVLRPGWTVDGSAPPRSRSDIAYWALVHRLMDLAWYRLPRLAGHGSQWGFRQGHLVDGKGGHERWIAASTEEAAMQQLLGELVARRSAHQ